jgi:adenylate cyclase
MSGETGKRRMAAVLAADVAGYSRLMGADEEATIAALGRARAVFREHVSTRNGRVVDTAGDSVLSVFESIIEAVRCALAVQETLAAGNADVPEDRRMCFRIGVHFGDIVEQSDGTVYGDGVNIAARLESLADPGGVMISDAAHMHVRRSADVAFSDAGEHDVKNIDEPVRAYRAETSAAAAPPPDVVQPSEPSDRPSIAVLAFENLSGDAEQEYFADGIAEDLITELSRLRWLLVTARNSSFTYKGDAVDVRQVGRELGARFVVEGSVRKGGERVRITAQLIDAESGKHLWAERYDRDLSDIFALQDEITETLVGTLQTELGEFERERAHRKPPGSLDAWECYQRGLWHLWQFDAEDMAEARRLFQRASDLDPNFAQPFAMLGFTLYQEVIHSYAEPSVDSVEQALRLANKAVSLDDKEAMAHTTVGRVQFLRGEYDAAIAELRAAIKLNPSSALAHLGLGTVLNMTGQGDEAIFECDTAIRLSPRDPSAWVFYNVRALGHIFSGDHDAAVDDARQASRHPGASFWPYATLASALAHLDRHEEARIALDKLLEVKPAFTPDTALAAASPLDPEALRPRFKTLIDGLRKAGLDIADEPKR